MLNFKTIQTGMILAAVGSSVAGGSIVRAHHVSVSGPTSDAGPITTTSSDTLGQGELSIGAELYVEDYDSFHDEELLHFAENGFEGVHNTDATYVTSLGIEYGVLDNFSVSLTLPYFIREGIREGEHHEHDGGNHGDNVEIHRLGTSAGLGDLQLGAKFGLLDRAKDVVGVALIGGLSIPTGDTGERQSSGERFETEFQAGTGSWDPKAGIAIGRSFGAASLDASAIYTLRTEGSQDTNLGDHLTFNAAVSWRLGKGSHVHDDGTFERHQALDLILEFNGEWEERERVGAERDINSGGTQLFVSPGIRYTSANGWNIYSLLGVPVYEDLNGIQNETDVRFKLGIGLSF